MPETPGHSATVEYGNDVLSGTPTYTQIAKLVDVDAPELEADDIDSSHMETTDQVRTFEPGWADAGEAVMTFRFEKALNATVYGLFRTLSAWRITFQDGSKWEFDGYLKRFGNPVEREGLVTMAVTVKVSGKPNYTAAA